MASLNAVLTYVLMGAQAEQAERDAGVVRCELVACGLDALLAGLDR